MTALVDRYAAGAAAEQLAADEAAQVPGPAKYRKLGDFREVMDGTIVMPASVYFIAGNHEPFAALDADGGVVTGHGDWGPCVTYLGRAGLVEVGGLQVGFLSGIFAETTFAKSKMHTSLKRTGRSAAHYTAHE